ncbi:MULTISPECIES: energy transducer TonB [Pseudomonas]|uniref:Ferric siderophore transport system, periplasmic binding protein TonB n=1 Tax=Pseudomonas chlororaphis subsp. aureofaciens TaxID=587851 RepID=A0AAD0ZIY1_9PSED|nr:MULTISPECIES: energy transducer TonB [Pseudomonas]AIC20227.1 energy transducer TonB [Pseudomonas chlororaphis]AZE11479.1 Ferric siderophore transport system, periplasmic binding protein TonB [Pseudomonas chlororaphis subsp. aureofaciens]AZE17512.1 Ferric siderophore transport system, periplasmic binding protein TonB [Pseudomonas chlororaphis subsp. aureofaciens]AZE23697.1 Ferric siderophore transport system, periplasmic binding protein TonB [Pseudomonas chlororaphis subsp. aureofaciens]AZE2
MYALFRARQLLGSVPALIALVLIALGIQSQTLKVQPVYDESAVEIALVEPEPQVAPEPVVEQEPPPPVIEDQEAEPAPPPPPPKPQPKPEPKPKPKPLPKPAPVAAKPTPVPTPPVAAKPVQPAVAPTPAPPAPPPAPKVDGQALEGGYLKGLRNELDTYKQYPSGRQASLERPSGEVVVWLLVDRQGRVLDSGIQTQASSMLLNRAATNSLRRIKQVKPFPEQAFGGRNEQRFTATFNYSVQ